VAGFTLDFGGRINELAGRVVWCGFGGLGFRFGQVADSFGFGLLCGAAFGLEFVELPQGLLLRALQALFVEAEVDEGL
jgi:hypothetical protein